MQSIFERIQERFFNACCARGMTGSEISRIFEAFHEGVDLAIRDSASDDTYEIVAVEHNEARMRSELVDFACSPMLDRDSFLAALSVSAQAGYDAQADDDLRDFWDWGDFIEALFDEDGAGPITAKLAEFGIEPILEPDYLPACRILTVDYADRLATRF